MEHLTKHQLILVALLVSFVTSLATGIVTVSLMDQAPQNITRTITQVIQKTVATAVPASATSTAAVSIAVDDQVADATANVTPSIVRLRDGDGGRIVGIGIIVDKSGTLVTDKKIIDTLNEPQAIFPSGGSVPITLSRFQIEGNLAFMVPIRPIMEVKPITFGSPVRLGTSVWALSGERDYVLWQGIVATLGTEGTSTVPYIATTIPVQKLLPGSPLFDAEGYVVGMSTSSGRSDESMFYPIYLARDAVPR